VSEKKELEETKRLMGALMQMKPKPHEDMKLGRSKKIAESKKKDSSCPKKKKGGRRPSKIGD